MKNIFKKSFTVFAVFLSVFFIGNLNDAYALGGLGATNLSAAETYTEDTTLNLIDIVVTDSDSSTVTATLTLSNPASGSLSTATSGAVTSTYVAGTGVWTAAGATADVNILLAGVTFVPALNVNSSLTIATSVDDGINTAITGSKAVTGTPVNDAPILDASRSPALSAITQDSGAPTGTVGTLVSSLVDFASPAGQVDNVTDVDSGASLGVAITGADASHGTFYYSTNNGTTWSALGAVSDASARILAANSSDRIYFQPSPGFSGTISSAITFRAWDQTSGSEGSTASTASNGGSTAFSTATDTTSLVITSTNHAPVLDSSKSPVLNTMAEDPGLPSGVVGTAVTSLIDLTTPAGGLDNVTDSDSSPSTGIAITATDTSHFSCYYTLDSGTTWSPIGSVSSSSAQLLAAGPAHRIYCRPNADVNGTFSSTITFRAWDQTSGTDGSTADTSTSGGSSAFSTATDTASLIVTPVNDAPVAVDDSYTIARNSGASSLTVRTNDTDVDGDTVTVVSVTTASHGSAIVSGGSTIVSYAPTANYCGSDTFDYTISDGNGGADTGTVNITITCDLSSIPVSLLATAISSSQINLSWSIPTDDGGSAIIGYKIERESPTGNGFSILVADTGNTDTTYSDSGLVSSRNYNYRVSAINGIGASDPSNESYATTSVSVTTNLSSIGSCGGALCGKIVTTASLPSKTAPKVTSFIFTRNLKIGLTGNDVKELQKFLNNHGFVIAISGSGSLGNETDRFGLLTKLALIKFQKAHQLKTDGAFGPKTQKIVTEIINH